MPIDGGRRQWNRGPDLAGLRDRRQDSERSSSKRFSPRLLAQLAEVGAHILDEQIRCLHSSEVAAAHVLFVPSHSPELQPCEHLLQFSDAPLVNRHLQDINELEDVQLARCAVLQSRCDLIRSSTLFSWWPKRTTKLQA